MTITAQEALQRTIEHREIFFDEMVDLMRQIMRGEVSPTMTAAILTGLRVKKETVGEIAGAATVMREFALPVAVADKTHLVDIVGTGGDGSHTFNISTCSMFVVAAAGAKVAKHGNRSVSSKSGSADAVEALGAVIELNPGQVARAIEQTGIGFMFAPMHHPAMKVVAPVRREMGAADQSGRRDQHPDGRVPSRPGRHPGARAARTRRRTRAGGVGPRQHGRDLAGRRHPGRRAARRQGARVRDPPGRLRHRHVGQPQSQGRRSGRVHRHAARRARQPARPGQRHRRAQRRRRAVRGRRGRQHRRRAGAGVIADGSARARMEQYVAASRALAG